jgi:hypothetical protein
MGKYYSIRVVEAESLEEATEKVELNHFEDDNPMCDRILAEDEILFLVKR